MEKSYIAIDLKSFYASVECTERGLDPMTTNLVVADPSRTEKTICLAVSPSLKTYGIPGRPRLFEVVQKVRETNALRQLSAPGGKFTGSSFDFKQLQTSPELAVDYLVAPPQMAHYMEISARIYQIYLKYIAPEDIHVYSIDEVFLDVTAYLKTYGLSSRELAMKMILDVLHTTGITATAGIGPNLYLCKIALDIEAKHIPPDQNGVRIAELDEMSYRRKLWSHRPLTDFWRVGAGIAKKLESYGMYTMGDVARCSLGRQNDFLNEDLLYRLFGVNAELLIDHAWGWEPCTMADIKAYKPESSSVGSGQVLQCPYPFEKARLAAHEMADLLSLDLVDKGLAADQIVLTVGYDMENLKNGNRSYSGETTTDRYGRKIPKHAHGTANLDRYTSSSRLIIQAALELFDRIVNPDLLVRRLYLTANHVLAEKDVPENSSGQQLSLFSYAENQAQQEAREAELLREKKMQEAVLEIKRKFGKNAILKGMNLVEGATAKDRNGRIGGHKA
ncbi:MAG TPA: DNA methylase [Candidatus Merdivicinus excrementipullorum]|uniref:DNA methylase n=1 Tax=Candidatus Merdivicinus excrementipullorum TaxID=2840867 RepID=A0A9D1FQF2_9FIRM|nr:DNA methylase [Candidatus Merdivicinus excrementipullorum]